MLGDTRVNYDAFRRSKLQDITRVRVDFDNAKKFAKAVIAQCSVRKLVKRAGFRT